MRVRTQAIDRQHPSLSIRKQCQLLGVNRSRLYYKPRTDKPLRDAELLNLIREVWSAHPSLGYRKLCVILSRDYKVNINHKRVLRLMQLGGLQAIYPRPHLSQPDKGVEPFPYLLKGFTIDRADQVWMVDITYLKLGRRFVYLAALIDVHSRYIVGWDLSFELDTQNCLSALEHALKMGTPDIINQDQGSQFTSHLWVETLTRLGIRLSMDGKGRYQDNIYIERFWRTIKYEDFFLHEYNTFGELYKGVSKFIDFYNTFRPHQSLGYQTPHKVYAQVQFDTNSQITECQKEV